MSGQELPPPSPSPGIGLFGMAPREILRLIADCIAEDRPALASLALVSPEFRQVARSYQFATVRLDLGQRSLGLVACLLHEAAERERSFSGATCPLTISACIRRLQIGMVNLDPYAGGSLQLLPIEDLDDLQERYSAFVAQLTFLLRPGALPNLEHFDTGPRFWTLEQPLIDRVLHSQNLRHLCLRAVVPSQGSSYPSSQPPAQRALSRALPTFSSPHAFTGPQPWAPLETLELDLPGDSNDAVYWQDVSSFVSGVLGSCALSLRTLKLRALCGSYWGTTVAAAAPPGDSRSSRIKIERRLPGSGGGGGGQQPARLRLPLLLRLRELYLDHGTPLGAPFLGALLGRSPLLGTLAVDLADGETLRVLVEAGAQGRLESLRDLVWHGGSIGRRYDSGARHRPPPPPQIQQPHAQAQPQSGGGGGLPDLAALLRQVPELEGFCITRDAGVDDSLLVEHVLPLLGPGEPPTGGLLRGLARLSLSFQGPSVHEEALARVGRITTLRALHLSAAVGPGGGGLGIGGRPVPLFHLPLSATGGGGGGTLSPSTIATNGGWEGGRHAADADSYWLVRHRAVRRVLANLRGLERLAFCGDDYRLPVAPEECDLGWPLGGNYGSSGNTGYHSRFYLDQHARSRWVHYHPWHVTRGYYRRRQVRLQFTWRKLRESVASESSEGGAEGSTNGTGLSSPASPTAAPETPGAYRGRPSHRRGRYRLHPYHLVCPAWVASAVAAAAAAAQHQRGAGASSRPAPWYWAAYVGKGHACRMRREAELYAAELPHLRSVFLGGLHLVRRGGGFFVEDAGKGRPCEDEKFDPLGEMFGGVSLGTREQLHDETALGMERHPWRPSKAYPPLRADDDDSDDDEYYDNNDDDDEDDYDGEGPSGANDGSGFARKWGRPSRDVPLRRFFCETCFVHQHLANKAGKPAAVLQTQCAHHDPRPSAAYMVVGPRMLERPATRRTRHREARWSQSLAFSPSSSPAGTSSPRPLVVVAGGPSPIHAPQPERVSRLGAEDREDSDDEEVILETIERDDDDDDGRDDINNGDATDNDDDTDDDDGGGAVDSAYEDGSDYEDQSDQVL